MIYTLYNILRLPLPTWYFTWIGYLCLELVIMWFWIDFEICIWNVHAMRIQCARWTLDILLHWSSFTYSSHRVCLDITERTRWLIGFLSFGRFFCLYFIYEANIMCRVHTLEHRACRYSFLTAQNAPSEDIPILLLLNYVWTYVGFTRPYTSFLR